MWHDADLVHLARAIPFQFRYGGLQSHLLDAESTIPFGYLLLVCRR